MLGRLLHLGSGGPQNSVQPQNSSSQPVSSLESVQEEIHTRNLLFPDTQTLFQQRNDQVFPLFAAPTTPAAASTNPFDYNEEVDIDARDVRVLIMQDTLGPMHTSLLFDSHPPPSTPSSPTSDASPFSPPDSRRSNMTRRKSSLSQHPRPVMNSGSPQQRQGAFDRRGSIPPRPQSNAETELQRTAREYREELAVFSSCVFGNSELMAYKGTSTKVHVVPSDTRTAENPPALFGDGRSSIGRSRSSKLSQSFSSQNVSPTNHASYSTTSTVARSSDRKKILITRLFPVNLTNDDVDALTPQSRFSDDNSGFPFPATSDDMPTKRKKPQPKQRRTPMYAVVLVVQLPSTSTRTSSAAPSRTVLRESGSYNEQDFMPSSYSSSRFPGWSTTTSGTYAEGTESSYSFDVEDRIDSLTQHWDIIMRTLSHLQSNVSSTLHLMLKQVDVASPGPLPSSVAHGNGSRAPSFSERRSSELARIKPAKGTTKLVSLWPNCLADDASIAGEVDKSRTRIARGLRAARVVTGQGRWGIWRDEAIRSCKWTASIGRGQFFSTLLTSFLATHTEWLQALAPSSYRRRTLINRQNRNEDDLSLPSRTIVVAEDKMVARRLIFLLTAFLPASQQVPTARPHRPSTSTSFGIFSQSPPSVVVPLLREESLRRKINRRTGTRRASHSRTTSQSTRTSAIPNQLAHLGSERSHERRASDAVSIRGMSIQMAGNDASRKSSAATTTTIVPEATLPHFSTLQQAGSRRRPRPDSSGSLAADDLKRSLQRSESGSQGGTLTEGRGQSTRWGGLIGGLWSMRRRESMDSGPSVPGNGLTSPTIPPPRRADRLSEMVREAQGAGDHDASSTPGPRPSTNAAGFDTPRGREEATPPAQPDRTPDPTGAFESPVKTSINADDGVIDVDVPFPEYMTSFESAFSSPSSSGYLSTPGFFGGGDSFEQSGRLTVDADVPQNTAGWLDNYHPDFILQAVPPDDDLREKIKASLRAEPTPTWALSPGRDFSERWVTIGSATIADTTTGTVSRLTYRRLIKPKASPERTIQGSSTVPNSYSGSVVTPTFLSLGTSADEEWVEERSIAAEQNILDAVDKIVTFSTDTSKDHSSASSQAHGEGRATWDKDQNEATAESAAASTPLAASTTDIPRVQCKTVMLSALEETIRDVIDKREEQKFSWTEAAANSEPRRNVLRQAICDWVSAADSSD